MFTINNDRNTHSNSNRSSSSSTTTTNDNHRNNSHNDNSNHGGTVPENPGPRDEPGSPPPALAVRLLVSYYYIVSHW